MNTAIAVAMRTRVRYRDRLCVSEAIMRRTLFVLACLPALPCGCMSVANHSPYLCADEAMRERPYGGVRMGAEVIRGNALTAVRGQVERPSDLAELAMGTGLCLIDLPLSAIADTIWLSHDIRATREKRNRPRVETAPEPAKCGEQP